MDPNGGYAYPASSSMLYSLPMPTVGNDHQNGRKQNGSKKPVAKSGVKVPRDKAENRELKETAQFEEDDNEDIAYLNFPLIWPLGVVSVLAVGFFLFSLFSMELLGHLSFERYALNQLVFLYGKTIGFCNNTYIYEPGMWPSFVRQMELKVLTNVCFRVAVCVPMAIRIFVAFIIRNAARDNALVMNNQVLHWLNELSAPVAIVEAFSMALFSIITIRFDYPYFYKAMFGTFIFSATLYMYCRTMLTFSADQMEQIDMLAGIGRLFSCLLFTWSGSQLFQTHQKFIHAPACHGYVPPGEALTEYFAILSYGIFALLQLVDIRNVRFICYPRTCSGECEPLRPENFRAGGKFEHCRAYEWAQRRMAQEQREHAMQSGDEEFPAKFSIYGGTATAGTNMQIQRRDEAF